MGGCSGRKEVGVDWSALEAGRAGWMGGCSGRGEKVGWNGGRQRLAWLHWSAVEAAKD